MQIGPDIRSRKEPGRDENRILGLRQFGRRVLWSSWCLTHRQKTCRLPSPKSQGYASVQVGSWHKWDDTIWTNHKSAGDAGNHGHIPPLFTTFAFCHTMNMWKGPIRPTIKTWVLSELFSKLPHQSSSLPPCQSSPDVEAGLLNSNRSRMLLYCVLLRARKSKIAIGLGANSHRSSHHGRRRISDEGVVG